MELIKKTLDVSEAKGWYLEDDIFHVVQDIWVKADKKDTAKIRERITAL
ncbi:hypothetical protein Barb4_01187 [Bacteroidales bacterium Barb4]|nr:hypothetical protein Barb4_01187 [Bacteroidales bacterium Barb4]